MERAKRTTRIEGLNLVYYQFGKGAPLLFLHGGRVRARTFKRLLVVLSKKYTIIAPDIPGFGASDTPTAAWSFDDYAAFFDAFLARLKIDQVTVVGYSMGGGIAASLASSSNRIIRLELVDASGIQRAGRRSYHDGRRLLFYATHPFLAGTLFVLFRDYAQYLWKHRTDRGQIKQIRRACIDTSYDDGIRRITVPTRLLWGCDDWIYPLEVAHAFQSLIPQAKLETVPGNHDWPLYNPLLIKEHMI